jgi:hypothetical protein
MVGKELFNMLQCGINCCVIVTMLPDKSIQLIYKGRVMMKVHSLRCLPNKIL